MGRPRKYGSSAERARAYRARRSVTELPLFEEGVTKPEASVTKPRHETSNVTEGRHETLTLLALADALASCKHAGYIIKMEVYDMVLADDPVLGLLVDLMEERLAFRAAEGEDMDSRLVEGGLTVRQAEACQVLSLFHFCADVLDVCGSHVPIADDAGKGVAEARRIAHAMGWPRSYTELWGEMSRTLFKEVMAWAFETSDYWPSRLRTLDDILRAMGTLCAQYRKYYAHLPPGDRPHEVGDWRLKEHINECDDPGCELEACAERRSLAGGA